MAKTTLTDEEWGWVTYLSVLTLLIVITTVGTIVGHIRTKRAEKAASLSAAEATAQRWVEEQAEKVDVCCQWLEGIRQLRKHGYLVMDATTVMVGDLPGSFCCEVFEPGEFTIKGNRVYLNVGETWHYDDVIRVASEL